MHEIQVVKVEDSPVEVFVFRPSQRGPRPGLLLLLLQHLPVGHTGLEHDEFTLRTAARFAEHGYLVAAPFLFHWWPKSADLQRKREESRDERMVPSSMAAASSWQWALAIPRPSSRRRTSAAR